MTDYPFLISLELIWLIVTIVEILRFAKKKIKTLFLSKFFPKHQEQIQEFTEEEKQIIARLAGDMNLIIHSSINVGVLVIIAILFDLFALIFVLIASILPFINSILSIAVSLFLMILFYWLSDIIAKRLDMIAKAKELYAEDQEINAEMGPNFDETEYLLNSAINANRLRQAIKEVEGGQCVSVDLKS